MMGDDGAGPLLAEKCAANPPGSWVVIDGGSAPENDVVAIRELRPDINISAMSSGSIRRISPGLSPISVASTINSLSGRSSRMATTSFSGALPPSITTRNTWRGSPRWRRAVRRGAKWRACRSTARL